MAKTLEFPSEIHNIVLVEKFVEDLRDEYKFGDDVYGNILVCLTEAANNAILHGNKKDPLKLVRIFADHDPAHRVLTLVVKDEGAGFDYNNLPDPTSPENLEKTTGRGVFLIMQLADLVIFSDNGATCEMQFKT
ncbi:MAG: ATP-binding protein [Chitinophagales bacterium]|nr:ATP-binding protein [Chitinophagales bacterium]